MNEYIPIITLITLSFLCIAVAVIVAIRSKKNLLVKEKDMIDDFTEKKKRKLGDAVGGMSFKLYMILLVGLPILVGGVAFIFMENKAIALLLGLTMIFVPEAISKFMSAGQKVKYEERYARALRVLSSCMRSQMTIQQAVDDVCQNPFVHDTVKDGFKQISADLQIGIKVDEAFKRMADDSGSIDAKDVASAIAMQSMVGGTDGQVIETLADNIAQRISLRKEIKSIFAQTEVMVTFMDFAPFIVILLMYFGAPQFMAPYFESWWMTLIFFGLIAFTVLGSFIIRLSLKNAKRGGGA